MANQKAGIVNAGPLRSFRFLARRPDGIEFIFWVKAHDSAGRRIWLPFIARSTAITIVAG